METGICDREIAVVMYLIVCIIVLALSKIFKAIDNIRTLNVLNATNLLALVLVWYTHQMVFFLVLYSWMAFHVGIVMARNHAIYGDLKHSTLVVLDTTVMALTAIVIIALLSPV